MKVQAKGKKETGRQVRVTLTVVQTMPLDRIVEWFEYDETVPDVQTTEDLVKLL